MAGEGIEEGLTPNEAKVDLEGCLTRITALTLDIEYLEKEMKDMTDGRAKSLMADRRAHMVLDLEEGHLYRNIYQIQLELEDAPPDKEETLDTQLSEAIMKLKSFQGKHGRGVTGSGKGEAAPAKP